MGNRTLIPFGPQHPVLPEPIHLDLVLEDEWVVEAIPSIGFIHRGLEKLVEVKDFQDYVYVAERICGICSFKHGMGYSMAVENVMGITVPERAEFLRAIWGELSRVHSHLLWLGLAADALGFENLFMHCWRLRETILDIFDMTTGGRVIFSVCKVGGVRKDISAEKLAFIRETLLGMREELNKVLTIFIDDATVRNRMSGLGYVSPEDAHNFGAVGPMARASGIEMDCRTLGYNVYKEIGFKVITETSGDCLGRTKVRIREIFNSIDMIVNAIDLIPKDTTIDAPVKGFPDGEYFARLEQPRGEVVYYIRANGTKFLERMRMRTPTFANIPILLNLLKGVELADVPILVLTIDPCISCCER
ncbi:MAG: nickel-dependent hydrogenase large subunit [Clostridiales Family XIII bacterium]|jgi:ech hydrogenase subunit E|nr:nickel-dependent hydrogenase large subunit [Clostridiales Family XIII bacterium]